MTDATPGESHGCPDGKKQGADTAPQAEANETAAQARVLSDITEIDAADWDACAAPHGTPANPFLSHAFLSALEDSASVTPRTGWLPQHIVLEHVGSAQENGGPANQPIAGVLPLYLKAHSRGEFVFDYAWADAFERAGGDYYPKLLSAVPFSPVTGRRFLVRNPCERDTVSALLLSAALSLADQREVSSFHANFVTQDEWDSMGEMGLLRRMDQQFHWANDNYADFDAFLETLASRKRKAIRKERRQALEAGLTIEHITGAALTEAHWDAFYHFYLDTGDRKWGSPYLNRKFFSLLSERMGDRVLLMLAKRGDNYVAGALNLIGDDTLYGRYWGCSEHHPCLHFELCYYQAIEYAIAHGLKSVEAGAQGEHKLARGYVPQATYSLHWIANPGLRSAVSNYVDREREYVTQLNDELADATPFKRQG